MVDASFASERRYDDDRFTARTVFESERMKVVLGYFEPGQFIPVHAPDSDVAVVVQAGTGRGRDGADEHAVEPGDVVVVEAGTERGVRADETTRLEAALVTAPPPTEEEHAPVHEGIRRDEFDPLASREGPDR
ncbi:cupin domain-containing protein [Halomarina halobia]|uniref:Cupin domain-containing protein n=1 Tax=Halomarina halobia TaxID=3033386 RepID=A0ABD6ACZ1_9EURY|nr:cupin domain-containing protein [Halomarina sp. PSR21]